MMKCFHESNLLFPLCKGFRIFHEARFAGATAHCASEVVTYIFPHSLGQPGQAFGYAGVIAEHIRGLTNVIDQVIKRLRLALGRLLAPGEKQLLVSAANSVQLATRITIKCLVRRHRLRFG